MNLLLDTSVVSERAKPRPDANVVEWLANIDEDRVSLSVATLAELRRGIEVLADRKRRQALEH